MIVIRIRNTNKDRRLMERMNNVVVKMNRQIKDEKNTSL